MADSDAVEKRKDSNRDLGVLDHDHGKRGVDCVVDGDPTPADQGLINGNRALFAAYWNGNVHETVAAMNADGIEVSYNAARHWVKEPAVCEVIRSRDRFAKFKGIATREERQVFWTRVMLGEETEQVLSRLGELVTVPVSMSDRLKASELLGKSECDFKEKIEHGGELTLSTFLEKLSERRV